MPTLCKTSHWCPVKLGKEKTNKLRFINKTKYEQIGGGRCVGTQTDPTLTRNEKKLENNSVSRHSHRRLKKRKSYTGSSTDWPSSSIGGSLFCFSLSFLLVSSFFLFSFSTTGLRRRRTSTSPRPPTARPTDKLNSQKKQQTNSLGKQNHRAFPSQFRTSVLRNSHPPHSALSRAILKPYYY